MKWPRRHELGQLLLCHPDGIAASTGGKNGSTPFIIPSGSGSGDNTTSLVDLRVRVEDGDYENWSTLVPRTDIDPRNVTSSDQVVSTMDTLRHEEVIRACLSAHRPLILCGPPGSGKTMTLTATLNALHELVLLPLNFSSTTTPELILKTLQQHCELVQTSKRGTVLRPSPTFGPNRWLVIFCDEINLPAEDKYGTVRVISFLRQLVEQGGFHRGLRGVLGQQSRPSAASKAPSASARSWASSSSSSSSSSWVSLERIQFVAACNPPTDSGRIPLSLRFLRHASLIFVDYPTTESLKLIYGALNRALLRVPSLNRGSGGNELLSYADPMTDAMVDFWWRNQARFKVDDAPQYIFSPRELSRWVSNLI